jgi:hypothetical protein
VRCVKEDGGDQIISLEQTTSEQDGTTQPCGETSVRGIALHIQAVGDVIFSYARRRVHRLCYISPA